LTEKRQPVEIIKVIYRRLYYSSLIFRIL